jgi:3-methylcrotonyl-CoA carboxylase alpha subunit
MASIARTPPTAWPRPAPGRGLAGQDQRRLPTLTDANVPPRTVTLNGDTILFRNGEGWLISDRVATGGAGAVASDGAVIAPMPGRIVSVDVAAGDAVSAGQKLLVLEAMKMEQALAAPFDGVVADLKAVAGAQVTEGTILARIDKAEA